MDKVMLFYREWAHYLYPNAKFHDFIHKVKRECSTKNMRVYLSTLRSMNENNHNVSSNDHATDDDVDFLAGLDKKYFPTDDPKKGLSDDEEAVDFEEESVDFDDDEEALREAIEE